MMNAKKIKEIYICEPIISAEPLYPLQKWYNQLIEKTTDEVTVSDLLKMLRQKLFVELAIKVAIQLLQKDLFEGEVYEGELLEKLSEVEGTLLKSFADELRVIVNNASAEEVTHEWSYDGEEDEFREIVDRITNKILR